MFTIVESNTTISCAPAIRNSNSVLCAVRRPVGGASALATPALSVMASAPRDRCTPIGVLAREKVHRSVYFWQGPAYAASMTTATRPHKAGARDRLIAAAERLFYAEGIHAVGVDRLCAEAEVSKRSLYQHFSGKDEVVIAMLRAQAAKSAALFASSDRSPRERILAIFEALDHEADSPDFRGCPFLGAATELKDLGHPAVVVAREQKVALTEYFASTLRAGGVRDADLLGLQLTLIFDGASAYSTVRGGSTPATRLAVETLLSAHGI